MSVVAEDLKAELSTKHRKVTLFLLCVLLFLRIPFLAGGTCLLQGRADGGQLEAVLDAWFEVGSYLCIAGLIWWEKQRLPDFQIDKLALGIIVLCKPLQTLFYKLGNYPDHLLAFPNPFSLAIWGIAILLVLGLWPFRTELPQLRRKSFKEFGVGILVGLGFSLALSYPRLWQLETSALVVNQNNIAGLVILIIPQFFFQLGYAAVVEEPVFRGFLWGYLEQAGWKNIWIWLFQAGLFSLAHIYYLDTHPISFWLVVPLGALTLGLLVWRYQSITSSMAAHSCMNAVGRPLAMIIGSLLR